MGNVSFFETIMGRKYYESTIPSLVRQFERIAENIERVGDGLIRIAKALEHAPSKDLERIADALEAQEPVKPTVKSCPMTLCEDPCCPIHGDDK